MPLVLAEVEWSQGIEDAWADVASFVPKFLGFLVVLLIGYIICRVIAKIVNGILERVGFDRAVERGGVGRALARSNYDASDLLGKVVFWLLFLFVLQMAFGVFGENPISDLLASVIAYLPKVIAAILIVVIVAALAALAREVIDAALGGLAYGRALANGVGIAIVVVGVFAALDQLEIAPSIVTGLFYAALAIVVGVTVVAVGGGGIWAMRDRWDRALRRLDDELPNMRRQAQGARTRIDQRAQERMDQARTASQEGQPQQPQQPQPVPTGAYSAGGQPQAAPAGPYPQGGYQEQYPQYPPGQYPPPQPAQPTQPQPVYPPQEGWPPDQPR